MTGDALRAAAGHRATARQLREAKDWEGAAMHQRRAIALYRGANDSAELAQALRQLADILIDAGELAEARRPLDEALALYADQGAPPIEAANALRTEAMLFWVAGDDEASLVTWRMARARYAALDPMIRAMTSNGENAALAEADAWIARIENLG